MDKTFDDIRDAKEHVSHEDYGDEPEAIMSEFWEESYINDYGKYMFGPFDNVFRTYMESNTTIGKALRKWKRLKDGSPTDLNRAQSLVEAFFAIDGSSASFREPVSYEPFEFVRVLLTKSLEIVDLIRSSASLYDVEAEYGAIILKKFEDLSGAGRSRWYWYTPQDELDEDAFEEWIDKVGYIGWFERTPLMRVLKALVLTLAKLPVIREKYVFVRNRTNRSYDAGWFADGLFRRRTASDGKFYEVQQIRP